MCARFYLPESLSIRRGYSLRPNRLIDNPDLERPIGRWSGGPLHGAEQADKRQMGQQRNGDKVADLRMLRNQHPQAAILNLDSQHWSLQ
jgi:hypothetical protein